MTTNKKILFIVTFILGSFAFVMVVNVALNFRTFGEKSAIEKAHSIAESVRDGLTSHMINETMENRFVFLDNMMRHQDVENLRALRAKSVIEQFGNGNVDVYEYDDIEKKVMATSKSVTQVYTLENNKMMRVTIPYIATKYSNPNCMSCHTNVKEGDVLGVISMDLDIEDVYTESVNIIMRIITVSFIFLLVSIFIANRYMRPYLKLFDDLEEGISKAYRGDFSHHVQTKLSNEAGEVAGRLNELSEIFRFKKTIELDPDKKTIYRRLAHILKDSFGIERFVMTEIDIETKFREVICQSEGEFEEGVYDKEALECRSFRTSSTIVSSDFHDICDVCCSECSFLCIPFKVGDGFDLILHIQTETQEELLRVKELIPIIINYFELAKPVLESKMLLDILHKTTLHDPMTGLYNRRFLDQFIDLVAHDSTKQFSVLMIDIDHFKEVNDNYGHDMGDQVIKAMAEVLKKMIKGSDIAVRYGGEEFLAVLFDLNEENALRIGQSIRHEFSLLRFDSVNENFSKTLSVGISLYPNQSSNVWQVVKYSDIALYQAKEGGRNQVVLFEPEMDQEL
ncbi:MAG: diguanylate cyclase [Campylobacterota bacterium]|nr:diguanylate cyclase [Campylobacterota bacterium]